MKTAKERREQARLGALELHKLGGPTTLFNSNRAKAAIEKRWAKARESNTDGPKDMEASQAAGRIPPDPAKHF